MLVEGRICIQSLVRRKGGIWFRLKKSLFLYLVGNVVDDAHKEVEQRIQDIEWDKENKREGNHDKKDSDGRGAKMSRRRIGS